MTFSADHLINNNNQHYLMPYIPYNAVTSSGVTSEEPNHL